MPALAEMTESVASVGEEVFVAETSQKLYKKYTETI